MKDIRTDIIVRIYFDGFFNNHQLVAYYEWIKQFIISNEMGPKVSIRYALDDGNSSLKKKQAQLYSKKEEELQFALTSEKFSYIQIDKLDNVQNPYHSLDLSFSFSLFQPLSKNSFGDFSFMINFNNWDKMISEVLIQDVIAKINTIIQKGPTKIVYGVVAKMPRNKKPFFYTSGAGNLDLTDEEDKSAKLFSLYTEQIKNRLWEPFWGNIITQDHLRDDNHFKELVELLGKGNVLKMSEGLIFFKMPVSINDFEYGSEFHKTYKKKIYELFQKYDALITE